MAVADVVEEVVQVCAPFGILERLAGRLASKDGERPVDPLPFVGDHVIRVRQGDTGAIVLLAGFMPLLARRAGGWREPARDGSPRPRTDQIDGSACDPPLSYRARTTRRPRRRAAAAVTR